MRTLNLVMARLVHRAHPSTPAARANGALTVIAALLLGACGSSLKVNTDFDRTADFSALRTYSWREGTPVRNQLMAQRVVAAVDNQLRAKGFNRVDSGGDFTVTYHAAFDRETNVQTFQTGSPYRCWGGCFGTTTTTVTPVTVGTLVIDLVDTKSERMLWRGSGTDTVTGDPGDTEKKINEAVQRMFEGFPPKA